MNGTLDKRLLSCADFVRAGAVFADIGTDHGYLPIFLLKTGRIERAYLSDVNSGPLSSAERNAAAEELTDRCEFILTDGAAALSGKGITDYAICGMGGELIAEIVGSAPDMRREGVRLILQPMSRINVLRRRLAALGFSVLDEKYSTSAGKHYVTLLAEYTGLVYEVSDTVAELGEDRAHTDDRDDYVSFLEKKKFSLERASEGIKRGGGDPVSERIILDEIRRRLSEIP